MKHKFWKGKRILITGGTGFLGKNLTPRIIDLDAVVFTPRKTDYDLRDKHNVKKLFKKTEPEIVIHAAAHVGGIGYMKKHPGSVFYDNIMMNTLVIEESMKQGIEKFVGIGTVCSYPKFSSLPFREENLWNGYPEETNASYGLAKKMMLVQTQSYFREFGFNGVHLLLANMYGPHDNFDPERSHVIPALIVRFFDAVNNDKNEVKLWGSGDASREFLYVKDAVEAIILATEKYSEPYPINISSSQEIKIKDLAYLISKLVGFSGKIKWDKNKLDGQPRRLLGTSKAKEKFGFVCRTPLKIGLKKTIEWYKKKIMWDNGR